MTAPGEIRSKALNTAALWGLIGGCALGIKGGAVCALAGLGLTLRRPVIYHYAKEYNLKDHQVAALSSASNTLIQTVWCVGLYAIKAFNAKEASIIALGLAAGSLCLDPATRFAWKNWGSPEQRIIQQNDQLLHLLYEPQRE